MRAGACAAALAALAAALARAGACVRKCCAEGEVMDEDAGRCSPDQALSLTPLPARDLPLVHDDPCADGKFALDPDEAFEVLADGRLRVPAEILHYPLAKDEYCLEVRVVGRDALPAAFLCSSAVVAAQQRLYADNYVFLGGLMLSVVFLSLTLYVYLGTRTLRNLYGVALSFFVVCLSTAYLFLATAQMAGEIFNDTACAVFAYIIQFSFLASFSWLTVMCTDSCWQILVAVGKLRYHPDMDEWRRADNGELLPLPKVARDIRLDKKHSKRIFWAYSVWAWIWPAIFLLGTVACDLRPAVPRFYVKVRPEGLTCFVQSTYGTLYIPVILLMLLNASLMAVAIYYTINHKIWHWNRKHPQRSPRQRAFMCLQLVFAMSLYWVLEVILFAACCDDFSWVPLDILNSFMGVLVFCISVLDPSVRQHVKKMEKSEKCFENPCCKCIK